MFQAFGAVGSDLRGGVVVLGIALEMLKSILS